MKINKRKDVSVFLIIIFLATVSFVYIYFNENIKNKNILDKTTKVFSSSNTYKSFDISLDNKNTNTLSSSTLSSSTLSNNPLSSSTLSTTSISTSTTTEKSTTTKYEIIPGKEFKYVQVINSCNYAFAGGCLAVRSGPGTEYEKLPTKLRNGTVLRLLEKISTSEGDWYKLSFNTEKIINKSTVEKDWYISAKYVRPVYDVAPEVYVKGSDYGQENKIIEINIKNQTLSAYDIVEGDKKLFMQTKISSGLTDTPTAGGKYSIYYKTPGRYMQSASGSENVYDLPGVPFAMYFNSDGSAIHGAYWHNSFGSPYSHGCINLPISESEKLYYWAPLGTKVVIK